ncbi:hypothetical protein [Plantactinospora sp. GCM10030261]|uniref:hypothetical protein n=1 Tax=Plantactinospora sp. GCM10030261 TaxID=3273420 RepID=UPI0036132A71
MKAHRTDMVSFTFALIFLAIAGWWLVAQLLNLRVPAVGWFVAGGLIVFGSLGLLAALRSGRGGGNGLAPAEPAPPPVADGGGPGLDDDPTWPGAPAFPPAPGPTRAEPHTGPEPYTTTEPETTAVPSPTTEPDTTALPSPTRVSDELAEPDPTPGPHPTTGSRTAADPATLDLSNDPSQHRS